MPQELTVRLNKFDDIWVRLEVEVNSAIVHQSCFRTKDNALLKVQEQVNNRITTIVNQIIKETK